MKFVKGPRLPETDQVEFYISNVLNFLFKFRFRGCRWAGKFLSSAFWCLIGLQSKYLKFFDSI